MSSIDDANQAGTAQPRTSTLLQEALKGTAAAATPEAASLEVVKACVGSLDEAVRGCAYMLDLRSGAYRQFVSWPDEPDDGLEMPADKTVIPDDGVSTVVDFVASAPELEDDEYQEILPDGIVVFAKRGTSCVGAIRFDGPQLDDVDPTLVEDLVASANLLVTVYEDDFAFNLLHALQDPIDFAQSDEEFFGNVMKLIETSSGMEFVALREWDEDSSLLRCIALAGFGDDPDLREWDLKPDEDPAFEFALAGSTVAVPSLNTPEHEKLRARRWCADVQSFVAIPVRVGMRTFGVLSVGARCEFEYAPIELRGFESIANGVGVSITNFRNSHLLNRQAGEYTAAALAMTSVEIARAARHEAVNYIENCDNATHDLWKAGGSTYEPYLNRLNRNHRDLSRTLDKIRLATKMPDSKWEEVTVGTLWEQAEYAVEGRLKESRVSVGKPDIDVTVLARPDWLMQVFFNLLLNSVDAFKDSKKGGRRIDLSIDRPSQRDNFFRLVYTDNASGINPQRLRAPEQYADLPITQQIFEGGVTSKKKGSGYGMWLARKIAGEHYGSIDLVDYSGGIRFVISLPTPQEARKRRQKEAQV